MRTLELFSGTKSFSKVAASLGHETFTVDMDKKLEPDLCVDILNVGSLPDAEIIWASPPCEGFSVCVIGRNWNYDGSPKSPKAELAMKLVLKTLDIIREKRPRYWFIENPRGMLRKMPFMDKFLMERGGVRRTVTYCQYGERNQKPTDIWTNMTSWLPKPICKPGSPCHEAQPRGYAKKVATGAIGKGTQGMKNAKERGRIPAPLFKEIFSQLKPKDTE